MVPRMISCLILMALCLVVTAYHPEFSYPQNFGNSLRSSRAWGDGAQDRTIWSRARSFLPRAFDVAGEAFGALLIPTLLVLGFQAVWPRRYHYNVKRSTDDLGSVAPGPMDDIFDHLSTIYYAATESEVCIQRIVCELGSTAKSLKADNKKIMISILGKAASKKYSKLFSKFEDGVNTADCKKIGCKLMD